MSLPHSLLLPTSTIPPSGTKRKLHPLHSYTPKTTLVTPPPPPPPPPPTDLNHLLTLYNATPHPSTYLYNALIRAHTLAGHPHHSLLLLHRLLSSSSSSSLPDRFTFPLALKACARLAALRAGEQLHALILKSHFAPADDPFILTSLLNLYSNCSLIDNARQVFDIMPRRTIATWNAMLDAFAKSGSVDRARRCFDEMPERNVISWNAMIGGYVFNELFHEALKLFLEMEIAGVEPDESTMVSVVSAVSGLGLLGLGRRAHGYVTRRGFSLDGALGVALISMYTKCGSIASSYRAFMTVSAKNVSHWTSVIAGFAAHGFAEASLRVFSEMLSSDIWPNHVTFVGVLNACSHGGLVQDGLKCFELMKRYGIEPSIEHYGCLVDLLGRSGLLEEALELALSLPMNPGSVTWGILLSACRNHGNVEIAELVAQKLIQLEPNNTACYVLLSNLYESKGKWEEFRRTREMMEEKGILKVPGFSWIEVDGIVHEFVSADRFHLKTREIYGILDGMNDNLRWAE